MDAGEASLLEDAAFAEAPVVELETDGAVLERFGARPIRPDSIWCCRGRPGPSFDDSSDF